VFGFGILLMHLSEYFGKRKYDKKNKQEIKGEENGDRRRPVNA